MRRNVDLAKLADEGLAERLTRDYPKGAVRLFSETDFLAQIQIHFV
jgi:hypothetical protein